MTTSKQKQKADTPARVVDKKSTTTRKKSSPASVKAATAKTTEAPKLDLNAGEAPAKAPASSSSSSSRTKAKKQSTSAKKETASVKKTRASRPADAAKKESASAPKKPTSVKKKAPAAKKSAPVAQEETLSSVEKSVETNKSALDAVRQHVAEETMAQKEALQQLREENEQLESHVYPLISLHSTIITPCSNVQMLAVRDGTVIGLREAFYGERKDVAIFSQIDDDTTETPSFHRVGILAHVFTFEQTDDMQTKAIIRGFKRVLLKEFIHEQGSSINQARIQILEEVPVSEHNNLRYISALRAALDTAISGQKVDGGVAVLDPNTPEEVITAVHQMKSLSEITDALAQILLLSFFEKKYILDCVDPVERAKSLIAFLNHLSFRAEVDKKIADDAREAMEHNQRDYYLHEQLKAIKRELNISADDTNDIEDYKARALALDAPQEVKARLQKEISRLTAMPVNNGENSMLRTYIETLLSMPWGKSTVLNSDLKSARDLLEKEHYGLRKVKDRILEFLAVQIRRGNKDGHGQILCLMGPPGIGKTSLGASIARATGRKYVRMALGGMYDESEIRGHRRTYIGAMPGRIVQSMIKAETNNPLFLLDEIDKISTSNFHGDIAASLLEVLDPEQNNSFSDNYVDMDFDLSKVLFIATANSYNIPPALLDRMEIIDLSSYTADEKFHIAREHLLPKQLRQNALTKDEFDISDAGIKQLIAHYTMEAGVRNLERIIGELCRKVVKELMLNPKAKKKYVLSVKDIEKLIGPERYDYTSKLAENRVGIVNGLSVSSYFGGDMLQVEVVANEGTGSHLLTGQLGDVMKESVSAAISWVRAHARSFSLAPDFFRLVDLHVHFPEGAIKKDGPSAGSATVTAIVSALTGNPVRADVAMTGEITLRGDVLAIGGLKEKLLAALRGGVKTVCIPYENKKDLWDMPEIVCKGLEIKPVKTLSEVLDIALENKPESFTPADDKNWNLEHYNERLQRRKLREEAEEVKNTMEIHSGDNIKVVPTEQKKDEH